VVCRYGDSYQWTTDGSCAVEHLLTVDTTATSMEQQVQQVLGFLQSAQSGYSSSGNKAAAAASSKQAACSAKV
jgi:hypothetical protein